MIYPCRPLSWIAKELISLDNHYSDLSGPQWAEFCLLCQAWKERTGQEVTVGEMEAIRKAYLTT